jgi:hypothetical protein
VLAVAAVLLQHLVVQTVAILFLILLPQQGVVAVDHVMVTHRELRQTALLVVLAVAAHSLHKLVVVEPQTKDMPVVQQVLVMAQVAVAQVL